MATIPGPYGGRLDGHGHGLGRTRPRASLRDSVFLVSHEPRHFVLSQAQLVSTGRSSDWSREDVGNDKSLGAGERTPSPSGGPGEQIIGGWRFPRVGGGFNRRTRMSVARRRRLVAAVVWQVGTDGGWTCLRTQDRTGACPLLRAEPLARARADDCAG